MLKTFKSTSVQLTQEQHGFELCKSTYMWVFPAVNTTVLHHPRPAESVDTEGPRTQRAVTLSYAKSFGCLEAGTPTLTLFKGQLYVINCKSPLGCP